MPHKRIALGLSGGVDSSVSAALLQQQGFEVSTIYLECWRAPGCRTEQDRKDALAVALQLGLSFQVLDFKDAYRARVVEHFFTEYRAGRTPNPDVWCNEEIKFGLFYDWAMAHGFDAIATGHYAQTDGIHLMTAVDEHKDQTYFLYRMRQEQLAHIHFPIGHLKKADVRILAQQLKLPTAQKKDSVGICFIGDIDVHAFLREHLGEQPGDVVDRQGRVIGRHQGLWFYTIGQRHGFQVFPAVAEHMADGSLVNRHNIPPFYVIGKHAERNHLIVGFGSETFVRSFQAEDVHWIDRKTSEQLSELAKQHPISARIRHTGRLTPCTATYRNSCLHITLTEPQQGLAAGQSVVLYAHAPVGATTPALRCLGGGIMNETLSNEPSDAFV